MKHIVNWVIRSILVLICGWLLISLLNNGQSWQPHNWFDISRDKIASFQEKTSNKFEEHLPDPHSINLPDLPTHTNQ